MTSFYDEIEIEDMAFDPILDIYTFPCPCGDLFQITKEDVENGEDIGICPSCSLIIRVIHDFSSDEGSETFEEFDCVAEPLVDALIALEV